MATVKSNVFTDYNSKIQVPDFYRNILAEQIDPSSQLRLIIEKIQTAANDKKMISTVGIVVETITTAYPQTFLNMLAKATTPGGAYTATEYKVVLVEDGLSLSSDLNIPNPHDILKHFLSRYYASAYNIGKLGTNTRVRITFSDTSRTDGWITEVL